MVRASPAAGATVAPLSTGFEVTAHVPAHAPPRARPLCCAFCGLRGRYVRHDTLARAGRPEHQRRFRSRAPPR
jgi:hypothetical protein